MLLVILTVKKLLQHFTKRIAKRNQKEFTVEKVIKRKDHKVYINWKGYDNSFNSWIDKNDIV